MPTGTITALRTQHHNAERVNVFIEESFAIGVSFTTLVREGLCVGKQIDAETWQRLEAAEQYDKALQAALRALQNRPRSAAELRIGLQRKRYPRDIIEATLARLTELGLLDDTAFARFWIEQRQRNRPRGSQALRNELSRKGVARDIIAESLSDEQLLGDEQLHVLALARRVLPKYADAPDRASFWRRLGGYLQRRGFSYERVEPVLTTLWKELQRERAEHATAEEDPCSG